MKYIVNGGETMKKVLVINDCKFESTIMKDYLSDVGYDVKVTSEFGAIIEARIFQPDILIANLIMKSTTGDKLISKIKAENSEIICILSSCDNIKLEDFSDSRVDEVINTPVNRDRLNEILDKAIKNYEDTKIKKKSMDNIIERLEQKSVSVEENANLSQPSKPLVISKFLFCPFCGQRFDENTSKFTFCPYCGKSL